MTVTFRDPVATSLQTSLQEWTPLRNVTDISHPKQLSYTRMSAENSINNRVTFGKNYSYLTQDEPERINGFSCKMSLKVVACDNMEE